MQLADEATSPREHTRVGSLVLARPHALVALLTGLTAALGLVRLDYRAVHFDESISIARIDESWSSLWQVVTREDPNMSLYYVLLKLWAGAFGDSLVAVRSLSVVAAALCVPVVYALGVRLFGVSAGLVAGLLVSTNVFFLRYAQEARAYALVTLFVALSTYFFLREAERPRTSSRLGYVASSAVAFHLHFFAAWVVFVHVATLVAREGRRALTRSWLACYAAVGALVAPMAYRALTLDEDPIGWLAEPGWNAFFATLAQLAGDSFLHVAVIAGICLLALPRAVDSRRLRFGLVFTAAWAVVPLLAAFAVSQVKPILLAKYLIVSLPAVALLAAGAVTSVRPRRLAAALACVLVAVSVPELRAWYSFRGAEDWRTLSAFVLERARAADSVVFNADYAEESVVDYARSTGRAVPPRAGGVASSGPRVWLVLAHSQPGTEALRAGLETRYRLTSRHAFEGDIAVELYTRRRR